MPQLIWRRPFCYTRPFLSKLSHIFTSPTYQQNLLRISKQLLLSDLQIQMNPLFTLLSINSFNSGSTAVSSLDCLLADMESFKSNKEANSRGRKVEIQVWGTILGGETLFHFLLSSRLRTRRRRRSWRRSWTTWRTSCLELFRLEPKPQRRGKRKAT